MARIITSWTFDSLLYHAFWYKIEGKNFARLDPLIAELQDLIPRIDCGEQLRRRLDYYQMAHIAVERESSSKFVKRLRKLWNFLKDISQDEDLEEDAFDAMIGVKIQEFLHQVIPKGRPVNNFGYVQQCLTDTFVPIPKPQSIIEESYNKNIESIYKEFSGCLESDGTVNVSTLKSHYENAPLDICTDTIKKVLVKGADSLEYPFLNQVRKDIKDKKYIPSVPHLLLEIFNNKINNLQTNQINRDITHSLLQQVIGSDKLFETIVDQKNESLIHFFNHFANGSNENNDESENENGHGSTSMDDFPIQDEESVKKMTKELKKRTHDLSSNTQDPLPDIEEEINHNQSIQKRKKKRTLRFDTSDPEDQGSSRSSFRRANNIIMNMNRNGFDSDNSDNSDEEGPSESPARKRTRTRTPNSNQRTVSQRKTKPTGRHPFSDEEVQFIIAGVEKFGIGEWKSIVLEYPFEPFRTSVDIKDKFRNLYKKKALPKELMAQVNDLNRNKSKPRVSVEISNQSPISDSE